MNILEKEKKVPVISVMINIEVRILHRAFVYPLT